MMARILLALLLGFALPASADVTVSGGAAGGALPQVTVAGLPTCDASTQGSSRVVTDATNATSCTVGGGTEDNTCDCIDGTWTLRGTSSTVADGDKGDISITGGTWGIDSNAVVADDIATDAVGSPEIVAGGVGTSEIATDGVSADELNATGVEAELEAVMDLQDMQGAVTDAQVPNNVTIDDADDAKGIDEDNDGTREVSINVATDVLTANPGEDADADLEVYEGGIRIGAGLETIRWDATAKCAYTDLDGDTARDVTSASEERCLDGRSTVGMRFASDYLTGSTTCGIQEAVDALTAGGIVIAPLASQCSNMTQPVRVDQSGIRIIGWGVPNGYIVGEASRLVADFDAIEVSSAGVGVEFDSDRQININIQVDKSGASAGESHIIHAGGSSWVTLGFEVGAYVRLRDVSCAGSSSCNGPGESLEILRFENAAATNDRMVVADPNNRTSNDNSVAGGDSANDDIWSLVACRGTCSSGSGDWGTVSPVNGVPFRIRFNDPTTKKCPWTDCQSNGRPWMVLEKMSATKLALEDPNGGSEDDTKTVDYVASPMLFRVHGSQLRGVEISNMAIACSQDDNEGDAFAAIAIEPNNDLAQTMVQHRYSRLNIVSCGNGDGSPGGQTDFSYLDSAIWIQGQGIAFNGLDSMQDQFSESVFEDIVAYDTGRCLYLNSVQATNITVRDFQCGAQQLYGIELESGGLYIDGFYQPGTLGIGTEFSVYRHDTGGPLELKRGYLEMGSGGGVFCETSGSEFRERVLINGFRFYAQHDMRASGEAYIDCRTEGAVTSIGNQAEESVDLYGGDWLIPNSKRFTEIGLNTIGVVAGVSNSWDPAVIETRNHPLPETGFCVSTQIVSPVDASDTYVYHAENAFTVYSADCIIKGTTSIPATLEECSSTGGSCGTTEAAITCDADGAAHSGSIDDATVDAGDYMHLALAAPTGTPTNLMFQFCGY